MRSDATENSDEKDTGGWFGPHVCYECEECGKMRNRHYKIVLMKIQSWEEIHDTLYNLIYEIIWLCAVQVNLKL